LGALGLGGSLAVAYAAPAAVADRTVGWWYHPAASLGGSAATAVVYAGMAALCVAWLALGARGALPSSRALILIAVAWLAPLALAPPLFSRDVYSYLAQGTILHLGLNPYHTAPSALGPLGHRHVLDAVSTFWRHTTAPYGPLFLELISAIVAIAGAHLIAGVLLSRLVGLAGLALLAVSVPRLARAMGSDAPRGLWLVLLNPLTALELVAAGHNDALMIGMLAAGVALALEGRPLWGIAVCAAAGAVKVPALAGALFIIVAWARAEHDRGAVVRFAAIGALVAAAVLGVVTVASGVGVSWFSTSLFSTPAKVHLAITPATAIGWTAAALLSDVSIHVGTRGLENALGVVAFALTVIAGAVALWWVRVGRLLALLGGFLIVAAAFGPAAWPWYFTWGLVLIAALHPVQRSAGLALACAASVFLVKPDGILALPLPSAPAVLIGYALIGAAVWWSWRRGAARRAGPARSAVTAAPVHPAAVGIEQPIGASAKMGRS
jgi:alpha-1,6-mannosyltransferase